MQGTSKAAAVAVAEATISGLQDEILDDIESVIREGFVPDGSVEVTFSDYEGLQHRTALAQVLDYYRDNGWSVSANPVPPGEFRGGSTTYIFS